MPHVTVHRRLRRAGVALVALVAAATPLAAETGAGTRIENRAALALGATRIDSNTVVTIVAERLDVALTRADPATPPAAGDAVALLLANRGNGEEAFLLAADVAARFAIDRNGDGRFDPAVDTLLTDARTPALAAGATLALLLLPDAAAGTIRVTARAVTGSGAPGTTVAGAGDGGGDAVVGPTGALATLDIPYGGAAPPPASFTKRQRVQAPDGSARAVPGAVITYTLEARFAVAAAEAAVEDPLPAGTRFVPGSLRRDGQPQADGDTLAAGRVRVPLGAPAAGAEHQVEFQVIIEGVAP